MSNIFDIRQVGWQGGEALLMSVCRFIDSGLGSQAAPTPLDQEDRRQNHRRHPHGLISLPKLRTAGRRVAGPYAQRDHLPRQPRSQPV